MFSYDDNWPYHNLKMGLLSPLVVIWETYSCGQVCFQSASLGCVKDIYAKKMYFFVFSQHELNTWNELKKCLNDILSQYSQNEHKYQVTDVVTSKRLSVLATYRCMILHILFHPMSMSTHRCFLETAVFWRATLVVMLCQYGIS